MWNEVADEDREAFDALTTAVETYLSSVLDDSLAGAGADWVLMFGTSTDEGPATGLVTAEQSRPWAIDGLVEMLVGEAPDADPA